MTGLIHMGAEDFVFLIWKGATGDSQAVATSFQFFCRRLDRDPAIAKPDTVCLYERAFRSRQSCCYGNVRLLTSFTNLLILTPHL